MMENNSNNNNNNNNDNESGSSSAFQGNLELLSMSSLKSLHDVMGLTPTDLNRSGPIIHTQSSRPISNSPAFRK